eukprot:TRINITY_DN2203_c0_g1_i1.p1 TRINITY_DN2203_c0_g1~~TRINITY_DN2203_c0_g1_i1.p1  ORF type:complete len:271 (+),score=73.85 TRINITY_DN2203_c0_g1_i1:69-815(+)
MAQCALLHSDSQIAVWRCQIPAGAELRLDRGELGGGLSAWKSWFWVTLRGRARVSGEHGELGPRAMDEYPDIRNAPPVPLVQADGKVRAVSERTGTADCVVLICAMLRGGADWREHATRDRDPGGLLKGTTRKAPPSQPGMAPVAWSVLHEDADARIWDQWIPAQTLDRNRHRHGLHYWLLTLGFEGCILESPGRRDDGERSLRRFAVPGPIGAVVEAGRTETASNDGTSPYRALLVEWKGTTSSSKL